MSAIWYITPDGWHLPEETDRRFNRIVGIALTLFVIAGIVIPLIQLHGLQRGGGEGAEKRYINLLPEAEVAPQVEEPAPAEEDQPKPEQPKTVEQKKQDKPPQPKTQEKPTPVQQPQVTQEQRVQQARDVAQRSGVLALQSQLSELQNQSLQGFDAPRPQDTIVAKAGTGASGGSTAAFERAATSGSSGIGSSGTGETRRSQSGTGLGQRRTTTVESPVGFGEDKTKPGQGGTKLLAGRTLEEIQLTFDRNKGAFYAIFNRAMRENPGLGAGKIVVSLTIAPNGSVTDCTLVSSTFNDPELERKVIQRVLLLNFGAKDVPPFTYPNYPVNFLPS